MGGKKRSTKSKVHRFTVTVHHIAFASSLEVQSQNFKVRIYEVKQTESLDTGNTAVLDFIDQLHLAN